MLNKVILIGHLGHDPDLNQTKDGTPVLNATLATSEKWNEGGQKKERTEWHRLVFWRRNAEIADQFLGKGSKIWVEGKIQNRSFEKDGSEKKITEVVVDRMLMLDGKDVAKRTVIPAEENDIDDELPF